MLGGVGRILTAPDVRRCHTTLALQFFSDEFDDLDVEFPVPPMTC